MHAILPKGKQEIMQLNKSNSSSLWSADQLSIYNHPTTSRKHILVNVVELYSFTTLGTLTLKMSPETI